jgi:membrane protease YdiL (CAAX protease family)
MTLDEHQSRRRLCLVVLLTLLPWPAVWLGLYKFDSLVWTFVLYHGCCLLPAALWGRRLWRGAIRWPTQRQWAALLTAVVLIIPLSLFLYGVIGSDILSAPSLRSVVTERGFQSAWLLPFGIYFVAVNATLEELFWRGVVLNELRGTSETIWTLGAIWTAFTFAAWHYVVLRLLLRPGWAEATVLAILGAGIFFAWLYRRTHSIIVPILWHGLIFDLGLVVVFGAIVRG